MALQARQRLAVSVYFTFAMLVGVEGYLFAVLICIYLMTNVHTRHFYIFFGDVSVQILRPFFIGSFVFLLLNMMGAF